MINYNIKPLSLKSSKFMKINILDSKELKFKDSDVKEISAIVSKKDKLYAIGDKGFLYHFNIKIKNKKIDKLTLKKVIRLKNKKLKKLKKINRDSEGLAFMGDDLLISFEKKPRVELFSKDGIKIKSRKISKELRDIRNYQSENKALEALAYSKKYGIITAPELPLKGKDENYHILYGKDRLWKIKFSGSITSLEFIDKNEIMILQRKFNKFIFQRVITISKLNLKTGTYQVLAVFDTRKGWKIDNFEGIAKIGKNKFLMISDDNGSFFQKTLLVLFEIL
jgi:hypothetical protein